MFDFSEVSLKNIIIHKVGSNQEEQSLELSESVLPELEEDIEHLLVDFFLRPFKPDAYYHFEHENGLDFHEMFQHTQKLFADPNLFGAQSQYIARHLHSVSTHPNIKQGEVYVVHFAGCVVDDEITDAIGIFKSENKDTFLKVVQQNNHYNVDMQTGINIKKLDKGCLIFNTEEAEGYKISIVDKTNQSGEAMYWMNEFLKVNIREDEFYDTKNYIDLCKAFSDDVLTEENNFNTPDIIDAFKDFKGEFKEQYETEPNSDFKISKPALKKQKKYFRPVIKLDKNFHLYVHGNPENMEKGFDDIRRMNYYKLYFNEEN